MTGENDEQKKGEGKGFAGLSSLVSDVDTTPSPPTPKKEPAAPGPSAGRPATQATQPKPQPRPTYQPPTQPSSGSSGGKWVLGIAAVIGVLWLIGQFNKNTTTPTSAYSPPAQTATPSDSPPPAEAEAPSRPQESMPPVGQDLVFSMAQIRYCLAEDIRMEGAKSALNNYSDYDVSRFNAMVADYNSRCGSFRYRSGALETARRDVEPYRSQLIEDGRNRLIGNRQSKEQPDSGQDDWWSQESTVEQRKQPAESQHATNDLDEAAAAIAASAPTEPTALPPALNPTSGDVDKYDSSVPEAKEAGPPANAFVSGANWYCKSGFRKVGERCEALVVPDNAFVSGANWYCNSGFRKVGERCEALVVPDNAFVSGANWYCNSGFRKVGERCEALVVPDNAFVSGANWYCNSGFRKVGERCEALVVPDNAFVSGANWYCNSGFRKVGERCEALVVPDNAFVSGANWYCNSGFRKVGDQCVSIFKQ